MQTYSSRDSFGIVPIIEGKAFIAHSALELNEATALLSGLCTVTIYISQGNALWVSKNETIRLAKGDLLIHNVANAKYDLVPEGDFGMFAVCVSSDFTRQFSQTVKISWKIRQALITNALFHLSPEDRIQMIENHDFLLMKCNQSHYPQSTFILNHLLHILSVEMLLRLEHYIVDDNMGKYMQSPPEKESVRMGNNTSAQLIFNRFTHLLEKTAVKNRPVSWWAKQLNISPKYLSAICREIEGKSAKNLISHSVILEATALLQTPSLSVKEISDRLGFVNQSHFGTFFKRHTGHSPMKKEE